MLLLSLGISGFASFVDDPSVFCFLLTTQTGGLGINLTGADRVSGLAVVLAPG